ncbi:hypothetical protein ACWEU6_26515, partial [Streptosporangium sandarakinum]
AAGPTVPIEHENAKLTHGQIGNDLVGWVNFQTRYGRRRPYRVHRHRRRRTGSPPGGPSGGSPGTLSGIVSLAVSLAAGIG